MQQTLFRIDLVTHACTLIDQSASWESHGTISRLKWSDKIISHYSARITHMTTHISSISTTQERKCSVHLELQLTSAVMMCAVQSTVCGDDLIDAWVERRLKPSEGGRPPGESVSGPSQGPTPFLQGMTRNQFNTYILCVQHALIIYIYINTVI